MSDLKIQIYSAAAIFLLWMISINQPAFGADRALLKSIGLQELSGNRDAPDFTISTPDGRKISLKESKGKVVILHFWATWCKPCKEEFPLFEKMHQRFQDKDVVFLPIAIDAKATQTEIDAVAKGFGASFPVFLARSGNVTDKYWTWGTPVTYFIDKRGWIIGRAIGPRDWVSPEMVTLIEGLLKE